MNHTPFRLFSRHLQRSFLCGALLLALLMIGGAGCNSSNSPVSTGFPSGAGYSINVISSLQTIPANGATTLTALIRTSTGEPVPDGEPIMVSSVLGGTLKDLNASQAPVDPNQSVAGGQVISVLSASGSVVLGYTPPVESQTSSELMQPSRMEMITFSYKGAYTSIELEILAKGF